MGRSSSADLRTRFFSGKMPRGAVVTLVAVAASLAGAPAGVAAAGYKAEVGWGSVAGASGYNIYIGYDADLLGTPVDAGTPPSDADGVLRAVVTDLPVGPTGNFTVSAYAGDGSESLLSNRLTLTYAEIASVVDSDGDGLTDAEEDVDLDGEVDPGETDPNDADSDGDLALDGAEIAAGTDPTDPGSMPASCGAGCRVEPVWIRAIADAAELRGGMSTDSTYAAGADADAAADALMPLQLAAPEGADAFAGGSGDEAVYDLDVPTTSTWFLWGRFYYPGNPGSNDANSFFVRVDDGAPMKLGNNKSFFRSWHWDGDGNREDGPPAALPLGTLDAGRHRLVIEKREAGTTPPRLDLLALVPTAGLVPTDALALAALALAAPTTTTVPVPSTTTTTLGPTACPHCDEDAIWLVASAASLTGSMTADQRYAGGTDADPAADALAPSQLAASDGENAFGGGSGDEAVFEIDLPGAGDWRLWGRFYYPGRPGSNDANSFFVRVDDGPLRTFGNNKDFFRAWHWDGDGARERGTPVALALGSLPAGRHRLAVEKREATPEAPRLDVLALSREPGFMPSDEAFERRQAAGGSAPNVPSGCTTDAQCDDGVFCTADYCDLDIGECRNLPFDTFCDDAVDCTEDRCDLERNGCVSSPVHHDCDDGDPCSLDSCESFGCWQVPAAADCDDGLACTTGDVCTAGVCAGTDACDPGYACSSATGECQAAPGDLDGDGLAGAADPCPVESRNGCVGPVAVDRTGVELRINAHPGDADCAGTRVDCNGDTWTRDFGYRRKGLAVDCGGEGCANYDLSNVFGCSDTSTQDLFRCSHAVRRDGWSLEYELAVDDGLYVVNLLFAGQIDAVLDVRAEDRLVYEGLEVAAVAGSPESVVVRSARVEVRDGDGLQLELTATADRATLSAIEILVVE